MDDQADQSHEEHQGGAAFPVSVVGLPDSTRPVIAEVPPGGSFDLTIHPVAKKIGDGNFRMLSYNGSIPGPTLRVKQGSEIFVNLTNETDMDTTVHWHGLRLENRYDGCELASISGSTHRTLTSGSRRGLADGVPREETT